MIELDLVRHGRTVFNDERRVQGVADSELTPNGRLQGTALGVGLAAAGKTYGQIVASDLQRARDTAQLAADAMPDAPVVQTTPGLREEDYGRFEGWLVDDYARTALGVPNFKNAIATERYTLETIADRTHAVNAKEPGDTTESSAMVVARIDRTLREIATQAEKVGAMRTLVVTHGTALLMWLAFIGKKQSGMESLKNASVTTVYYEDGVFRVGEVNNTSYLANGTSALQTAGKPAPK